MPDDDVRKTNRPLRNRLPYHVVRKLRDVERYTTDQ